MKTKRVISIASLGLFLTGVGALESVAASRLEQLKLSASDSTARPRNGGFIPIGAPERTHSGASRQALPDQCGGLALLPKEGGGLTTRDELSLYVYFAEGTVVDQAMLSLKSPDESEYYEAEIRLPREKLAETGGVIEVAFPDMPPVLTENEDYMWSLVLKCNGQMRPDSPILGGAIKRVASTANIQDDLPLAERAQVYGDASLWYDVLGTVASMRRAEPTSAQAAEHWSTVLETVGLEMIADAPLLMP